MTQMTDYYIGYVAIQAEILWETVFATMMVIFLLEFFDWVERQ